MKKLISFIFIVGAFVAVGGLFLLMSPRQTVVEQNCIAGLSKSNPMNLNVAGYCGCLGKTLGNQAVTGLSDAEIPKIYEQGGNCIDEYVKPFVDKTCVAANARLSEEQPGTRVDCNCFFDSIKSGYIQYWVSSKAPGDMEETKKRETIDNSVKQCLQGVG